MMGPAGATDWRQFVGPVPLLLACTIGGALAGFAYVGIVSYSFDWVGYLVAAVGGAVLATIIESRHEPHWGPKA